MKTMTKTLLVALAVTVGGAGLAVANADERGKGMRGEGPRSEMRFERIDADSDGSVTFAEFSQPMLERFAEADADGDGLIIAEEIAAAAEGRRAGRMAERMIERFDIDGDDQVSVEELANRQQKMFALMDIDDSGAITEDELPRRMAGGRGGRGGDRGNR